MKRELLEKPFAPTQIRQRKGRNGLLDYVEGHTVIQRLNEALEGAWSFEIVHHEIREEEVLVIGRLSADGITKMAVGGNQITRERASGQPLSLGDDLKAAATDALKKCATLFGVGLHLYGEKPFAGAAPAQAPGRSGKTAGDASHASTGEAPTSRQLEAIQKVTQAKGLDPAALESMSLRLFNRKPDGLTRTDAAVLLKELSNLQRRVA